VSVGAGRKRGHGHGHGRGLLAAAACALLVGCATIKAPEYGRSLPAAGPLQVELASVPFFPDDEDQCGPAALATVLQSAGINRDPAQLKSQVYLPQRRGSLQFELLGAARRAGAIPYVLRPLPDDLLREVAAGNPVVVLQDVGLLRTQWHYAVVVGYDVTQRLVTLRSGTVHRLQMPIDDFDRTWVRSSRWAFVALPPGQLPATANEADYVAAAADFARVTPTHAAHAYETALNAWPTNLFARMALGNTAYHARRLDAAREHYRLATVAHPDSADAWNNLAQVLFEQGQQAAAAEAAQRAVSIGGPRAAVYARTQAAISQAAAPAP
jgi:tetratricopeptide (TPR) repeat protein